MGEQARVPSSAVGWMGRDESEQWTAGKGRGNRYAHREEVYVMWTVSHGCNKSERSMDEGPLDAGTPGTGPDVHRESTAYRLHQEHAKSPRRAASVSAEQRENSSAARAQTACRHLPHCYLATTATPSGHVIGCMQLPRVSPPGESGDGENAEVKIHVGYAVTDRCGL